jgi:hypothetical protein
MVDVTGSGSSSVTDFGTGHAESSVSAERELVYNSN